MNHYPVNRERQNPLRASAGDEIGLLTNLVKTEQIGAKMLLQNVTEILADDESLLVDIVLLITDTARNIDSDVSPEDYASALIAVQRDPLLKAKPVLISAINHAANKAGVLALPS